MIVAVAGGLSPVAFEQRCALNVWLQTFRELRWSEAAIDAIQRVIDLPPDDAQAWGIKGEILTDLQRHAEVHAAFDQALALRPDWTLAWLCVSSAKNNLLKLFRLTKMP